ncbi:MULTISPECIES: lysylphosphatidylglycerol synthase transmembrane domain-containing protein [unclassified Pseudomonas]|uniref:lysylphosphatidylglycerol synthase transmembrane domain-containing protein n=1 Tax=unclassified Pseudomonas TaxID=196821 RepID=UPI001199EB77|nr:MULTISPECIES: lysylphosphatidylglycerol synthase transmembrane domain-containing protein [unclassified Pseudomonas]TWC20404.1 uncharacterized protein (TIRG00374 family) [Pseudomonas sp. SJZ075]TWC25717.1 uncharacterized protein (TIRG00374 family) [Pseudomonas sp. SJZ074]TWC35834.1 uncharacterized protein (TIRG00374 family) [Pseudomonas sp. SJZ078]TWC42528.1 uncharacterized protein (TIRG00374 family) [Pseudomonas sp. SJZ085]TWC56702.1 uncharacterized protein (TIRG00374 family) [Pseudomonas s
MNQAATLAGWRYQLLIGSAICSALVYLAISLWGGWAAVSGAVSRVGWGDGAQIIVLVLLGYGLRFLRWQVYLRALGHTLPCWPSLKIYLSGFALTTTPGKAGEALRGVLLKRWDVPYAHSFAALLSERFSDLLAIVVLALLGLSAHPKWLPMMAATLALLVCGVLLMVHPELIGNIARRIGKGRSWISRMLRYLVRVLLQARRCHTPRRQIVATLLSLMAWGLEVLAFDWILRAVAADVPLTSVMFIYAISMLIGALSFIPAGLGSTEAVMVALLVSGAVATASAIAATILLRVVTLWLAVGLGAVFLIGRERSLPGR